MGGKSVLPLTPGDRLAKRNAARKGHGLPPLPDTPPVGLDPSATGDLTTVAQHDAHLGRPMTWPDSLKRLQLIEQQIINGRRQVELERAQAELDDYRGKLVPRADLDRVAAKGRDCWWREVSQISGLVLPRLADLPGDLRARIKVCIEAEVEAAAARVRVAMEA